MKNPLKNLLFFFILTLTLIATNSQAIAADKLVDRIAVIVNQDVITENQLDLAIEEIKQNLQSTNSKLPDSAALKKLALDNLIDTHLQLQSAQNNGLSVSEDDLNKAIEQIANQNNLSTDQLTDKIESQGININKWHKDIRKQILIQKVQQQAVAAEITLTNEEINSFSKSLPKAKKGPKEYQLQGFLIELPDNPSKRATIRAKKRATKLASQLRKHKAPNMTHASTYQIDWQTLENLPESFSKFIPKIPKKQHDITNPILTGNGYHVLKIIGIRNVGDSTPIPTRDEIRKQLFEQKYEKAVKKWLKILRSQSTIQMHPDS